MLAIAAGPYRVFYSADLASGPAAGKGEGLRSLGVIEGPIRLRRGYSAAPVLDSFHGETLRDAIYRGGDCRLSFVLKEWTAATRDFLWPFASAWNWVGPIGARIGDFAGALELISVPNSAARSLGPQKLRFGRAIVAPSETPEIPLGAVPRDVPVVVVCLPYINANGELIWCEQLTV